MNILIANKFFFINGGTDRYLFNIMKELELLGHRVIPFSVRHSISRESPYQKYFLAPPGDANQTHYANIRLWKADWLRLLDRSVYSIEARLSLDRLLTACGGADVAYLLNIYNYMSPSIISTLARRKIPVVMRLGDYNLQCANYLFLRNGKPCVSCARGEYIHALRYRCLKNNLILTSIRVISMYVHRILRLYDYIRTFIVPCYFMKTMLVAGGIPARKIVVLSSPVRIPAAQNGLTNNCPLDYEYILYFGRISYEKGIDTLIRAYQSLDPDTAPNLVLVGRDYDGEISRLKGIIGREYERKIHFIGFLEEKKLHEWIRGCLFTVVPSRWYDNAPLSVYESYALRRPVLGARIGGLEEQVENGVTGRLFLPDSVEDLADGLRWMLGDEERLSIMGSKGYAKVVRENNIRDHIEGLLKIFTSVL